MKIYRDGVLVDQDVKGSPLGSVVISSLEFGQADWVISNAFWAGSLDDIRIYEQVLSAGEVQQLNTYQSIK